MHSRPNYDCDAPAVIGILFGPWKNPDNAYD
jgi:hypothetical protein